MPKKRSLVEINYIFLFILFIILLFSGVLYFLLALPRCVVSYPFTCYGHEFEDNTVNIYLKKNPPDNMYIKNVYVDNCKKPDSDIILVDEIKAFTLDDCNFKFFYKNEIVIEYQLLTDSRIVHSETGFISGAKGINL